MYKILKSKLVKKSGERSDDVTKKYIKLKATGKEKKLFGNKQARKIKSLDEKQNQKKSIKRTPRKRLVELRKKEHSTKILLCSIVLPLRKKETKSSGVSK